MSSKRIFRRLLLALAIESIASGIFLSLLVYIMIMMDYGGNDIRAIKANLQNGDFSSGFIITFTQTIFITMPLIGICSDRWGRKRLLLIAIGAACLSYMIVLLGLHLRSLDCILIALFLLTFGNTDLPLITAATTDISKSRQRAWYFGLLQLVVMLVPIVAQFTDFIIAQTNTLQIISLLLCLIISLEAINFIFIKTCLPETSKLLVTDKFRTEWILLNLSTVFSKRSVQFLFILLLLVYFAWGIYFQYIYNYLTQHLLWTENKANILLVVNYSSTVISTLLIYPFLLKYFPLKKIFIFSLGITGLGFVCCSLLRVPIMPWLITIAIACGTSWLIPMLWTMLSYLTAKSQYGLLTALMALSWAAAWMFSNISTVLLNSDFIIQPSLLILIVIIGLIAITIFIYQLRQPYFTRRNTTNGYRNS